jgi:PAS domain S-box-containing protein
LLGTISAVVTNEPIDEGADPPCWAHLFEEGSDAVCDAVLAELVRGLADAVLIADTRGTIVFWNAAAERLFGWPAGEAVGESLDLIVPERLRNRHWEGWHRVMATGETKYGESLLEVPAQRRDGQPLSIAFTVSLLTDVSGVLTGVAAVLRDDTARWQERRAQRDELARLRADPRLAEPAE